VNIESILKFICRLAGLIFGWKKQKNQRPQPAGNSPAVPRRTQHPLPPDEPTGSNRHHDRSDPDPLPPPSPTPETTLEPEHPFEPERFPEYEHSSRHPPERPLDQTTVNLTGWCLLVAGSLSAFVGG